MKKRTRTMTLILAAVLLAGAAFPCGRQLRLPPLSAPAEAVSVSCVSGFVYEAVRSNRIEGATATLYRKDAAGRLAVWDPGDSGQENPRTTDAAGAFRWTVPEGDWRVVITKEHYKEAVFDGTADPYPGKEAAIPLVSDAAPEVVAVIKKRDKHEKKDYYTLIFSQYMDRETVDEDTVVLTNGGKAVDCNIYPMDGEVSGASEYVYYATSFNLSPEKDATELTVRSVANYAGVKLKGTYAVPMKEILPAAEFTLGDADGDGSITSADARLALRASVGLFEDGAAVWDFSQGSRAFSAADCDGSGRIEAGDARTILRASVGLELRTSNSPLAGYVNLTDKHDDRTHRIDRITLHHMDGVMTAQGCCDYFCETEREVSANYCIGYDGSIALNVEEKYRPWTSSSEANDMRAVTIEVSNDRWEDDDRHVSDASLAALIDLCTDICLRNNINELTYTGDAYGSLTVHKMFIETDCPGPYLTGKCSYIAEQVNKRLAQQP